MAINFLNGLRSLLIRLGSNTGPTISSDTGSPEAVLTAPIGSLYLRTDGGANTTTYRKESGVGNTGWIAVSNAAGGSGSPGGATGKIQYNNAGAFGGATNVEVEGNNLKLLSTTDPVVPTGGLLLYAKLIAGRVYAKVMGPSGLDTRLQPHLGGNSVFFVSPTNSTVAPNVLGGVATAAVTISHVQTAASVNPWQATRRTRFTTAVTAASATGIRTLYGQWFLGNAAGFGGFTFRAQFGQNINLNGGQSFCGMAFQVTAIAGEPSGMVNMIGMGYDAVDVNTGNWKFMRNDGTGVAVKVDLPGAPRNINDGYDLEMTVKPNSAEVFVKITNLHTNVVVLDTSYTTDIPALNTFLSFKCEARNGAIAAAHNIELAKASIESDY